MSTCKQRNRYEKSSAESANRIYFRAIQEVQLNRVDDKCLKIFSDFDENMYLLEFFLYIK